MNSAPNAKRPDPGDFLLARADKQLSNLAHDAALQPSDPVTRMTAFRPAAVNDDRPFLGRRAVRGFTGFLLTAACIGVAAIAWQSFYAYKAKQPRLILTASLENPELPAQPSPSTIQADAAKATPPQPAPPQPALLAQAAPKDGAPTAGALPPDLAQLLQRKDAAKATPPQPAPPSQTPPEDVAPTNAVLPPELAQVLQTMSRDLATVGQGIEELKASQEQMARDNAKIAEQLKASQEQMSRVIVRASEQNLRPKTSAPRPPNPAR